MYHDDDDLHMCISCHATIAGLENYISHRNAGPCKAQHSVKRTEAPIPVLSPLEISKSEQIRPISSTTSAPSGENLNFLNADFFFSSLELQSRRKDGVFEEVMGIEEVLDEEYEVRENGGQRTVYSSGGKWGYEDYTTEREMWGGGSKGGEGLDGGDFHEDDVDLHSKSETFKEKSKKKKDKNLSICETEENTATFDESLGNDVDFVMRNASPTKSGIMTSPIKIGHPPEDVCLSDANKESVIGEFGISLDSCNLVMDSLNSKEDKERYKNASAPPSGHTRGKWIPGSASEGIRKSGNAVEYFCKPCNKNIRNRRSYEAHLSTSCHLKKLMKNSAGQGCTTTSEGPRLRSRRILLSKPDSISEKTKEDTLVEEGSRSQENKQKNSISDSQIYLMNSLGVKRKISEDLVSEDCLENIPSSMNLHEKTENALQTPEKNALQTPDDKNDWDASTGKSDPKKRKHNRKILKRACKSGFVNYRDDQDIDDHTINERIYPEVCEETLPIVNNFHANDEPLPSSLKECNDSIPRNAGIDLPSKKSGDHASLSDIVSIRNPVVNLGYRCDSEEFQKEREKLKGLVNTRHSTSSHQSSDKSLQDEMLFGLELMRTESNIPGGLTIRNAEVKESSAKRIDHQMPEKIDEMNEDKNDSNFHLSEIDSSCLIVDDRNAHLYEESIAEDVADAPIKFREDAPVIQSEAGALCNDSADYTLSSKSSMPHILAESVNINDSGSDANRDEIVNNLSNKASIATQAAIEDSLQPKISAKTSKNMEENVGATVPPNSNVNSKSRKGKKPTKEIEYFVVIKSSFHEQFKNSQVIVKNAKKAKIPASANKVTPENIQVHHPNVPTLSNATETAKNRSGKNVERRNEENLGSLSHTVNNGIRSVEDLRRQELKEQSLSATFINSQEQKSNDKNVGIELGQGSSIVLNGFETPTQKLNQMSQDKGKNKPLVFLPVNLAASENFQGKDVSFRTSKENFIYERKKDELRVSSYDGKEGETNAAQSQCRYIGNFSFEQKIPGSTQFPGLVNKFSFPVQSNLSQNLNVVVQVDAGPNNKSHVIKVSQKTVPEPPVIAPENQPKIESKGSNIGEEITVPTKRFRPLLPKLSNHEPPREVADHSIFSNSTVPWRQIIPVQIPLIAGNGLAANQSTTQIGSTVGVSSALYKNGLTANQNISQIGSTVEIPSAPLYKNPSPHRVNRSNKEEVLLLLQEGNNAEVSQNKVNKSIVTMNSVEEPAACIPIEIHRQENKEPSEVLISGREEDACTDPVKYVCGLCGYQSERFWCVERHIAQHLPREKEYPCEKCHLKFFSVDSLKQHSKRHEPKKWNCNVIGCHQAFATKNEWLVHALGRHATVRTHKCTLCKYAGKNSQALERHMKNHTETDRNVECNVCSKVVKKDCLERHKKVHYSEEFYVCPHCDFKTTFLTNLRRHIKLSDFHPGKKLYSCPFCVSDGMSKDERTCSLKEIPNPFSANSGHEMLEHINTNHPEEEDFSFKYHNAGELLRRLLAHLRIYNPRREVFGKNRNEDSPEKYSSDEGKNERIFESGEVIDLEGDDASNQAIGCPAETSDTSIYQKSGGKKDLLSPGKIKKSTKKGRVKIRTDIISDEIPSSLKVQTRMSTRNNGKNYVKVDVSQGLNADIGIKHLVKEKNCESLNSQRISALKSISHSSVLSTAAKKKSLSADDAENPSPQAINNTKASEDCFSGVEKEPQICCISNVFTMAESNVDEEFSSGEIANLKDSCSDNVETSSVTYCENEIEQESIPMEKGSEIEVIDCEEGDVPTRNIKETVHKDKTLALPKNNTSEIKTSSSLASSGQSTHLRCDTISDSHDLMEKKTNNPSKQKRKVPRWSSVVEIIEKKDGVISLYPSSP